MAMTARFQASFFATSLMGQHRFRNLIAHPHHRVQRGHRLLKNHGQLRAAQRTHRRIGQLQQPPSDRLDAGRAGELLGQLLVGVDSLAENREDESALGLKSLSSSCGSSILARWASAMQGRRERR